MNSNFVAGQYWLGLRNEPEPRRPFLRQIIEVKEEHIKYRFWSCVEPECNNRFSYSIQSWKEDRWKEQIVTYKLTLISESKAQMLINLWSSDFSK